MTDKQRAFVEHYLACWDKTKAAKSAGFSEKTAGQIGYQLLQKTSIQQAIQQRLNELKMSADEVLLRLADQARGSMEDFLDEDGRIDLALARQSGKLHLIKTRSVTKEGERIELYSAQSALELIGKHHRLFADVHEIDGSLTVKGYATKDSSPDAWDDTTDE